MTSVTGTHDPTLEPLLIHVPAGPFVMGSDARRDANARPSEAPQHTLHLPAFAIARTPITSEQYAAFVAAAGHPPPAHWHADAPPSGKAAHPVVHVSWYDAVAYCRWLSELAGRPYRLPGEAEWEKAARGTDGRIYPWGDRWDPACCNTKESGSGNTTPVGSYPHAASPYGVLDMAGNVYEWTASLWGEDIKEPAFGYPYDPSDGREDPAAGRGVMRVLRGGAFYYSAVYARAAHRVKSYPDYRVRTRGFRVCTDAQHAT